MLSVQLLNQIFLVLFKLALDLTPNSQPTSQTKTYALC